MVKIAQFFFSPLKVGKTKSHSCLEINFYMCCNYRVSYVEDCIDEVQNGKYQMLPASY